MGENFTFKRNINGHAIELYPKTHTTNVIKVYNNKEVPLDKVVDNKGKTLNYIEPSKLKPSTNDLIIEMLGDVILEDSSLNINGTIVSDNAPDDVGYLWIDTSDTNISIMKYFNKSKSKWLPVDINIDSHSHIGMIIQSTTLDTMQKVIEIYGGKRWTKLEGQFLLGASDKYMVNSTGGESEHTLTIDEIPSHSHQQYTIGDSGSDGVRKDYQRDVSDGSTQAWLYEHCMTGSTGGNVAHNNMPPYKAIYIWERTA